MTRSKIQKMKFFIFLLIFLLAQTAVSDGNFREKKIDANKDMHQHDAVSKDNQNIGKTNNITSNPTGENVENNTHDVASPKQHTGEGHVPTLNPGALLRGFSVFIGLSVLVLAYIVFRSFRLNKSRTQMVRKYGVLAHRQDVEMRPLPLEEEDDEDTTVFDASNVLTNNTQHQTQQS